MKITLEKLVSDVKKREASMEEPQEVTDMIQATAKVAYDAIVSEKPVTVLTDYDADGICSAYIFKRAAEAINPYKKINVLCNDRRGAYGVPKFVQPEKYVQYVIFDTGCAELTYINETFGTDTIVCDHHLITDDETKERFCFEDRLLDPHSLHDDDSKNAQYCATGLAYRLYQEMKTINQRETPSAEISEKIDNTLAIMACIGTIADVVNLMDSNSLNREIVKSGIEKIDNATKENTDFTIGYMLAQCGIGDNTATAKDIGFSVGAFLNSASRMSETTKTNGAQVMFNMLTNGENNSKTYVLFDRLKEWNAQRKSYINAMQDEHFYNTIVEQRSTENKIFVYMLPENTPTAFAGLVAGKLSEATDKAVICLTYHSETQRYSGSGRNVEGADSLNNFISNILHTPYAKRYIEMNFGGHHDAIGISNLNDADKFDMLVKKYQGEFKCEKKENLVLDIPLNALSSHETLKKIRELEPIGNGLKLPPAIINVSSDKFVQKQIGKNEHWKSFNIIDDSGNKVFTVKDWNYDDRNKAMKESDGNVEMLVSLEINNFNGSHLEGTTTYKSDFFSSVREQSTNKSIAVPQEKI